MRYHYNPQAIHEVTVETPGAMLIGVAGESGRAIVMRCRDRAVEQEKEDMNFYTRRIDHEPAGISTERAPRVNEWVPCEAP